MRQSSASVGQTDVSDNKGPAERLVQSRFPPELDCSSSPYLERMSRPSGREPEGLDSKLGHSGRHRLAGGPLNEAFLDFTESKV